MSLALTIIAIVLLVGSLALAFASWRWAALTAFAGLLLAWLAIPAATRSASTTSVIIFGATALIIAGLNQVLPRPVSNSRKGVGYLLGGSLVGAALGCLLPGGMLMLTVIAGGILGALAYGATPGGRALEFPSQKYFRYVLAKGFPAVVTVMLATVGLITVYEFFLTR